MRIFNWVHRKLHHNVDYCMVSNKKDILSDGGKKVETITCDKDTDALLLDHMTLVDVLDGWQDGILTIGTFGLDQLNHLQPQDEYSFEEEDYSVNAEEVEEDGGELNPLAVQVFKQQLEKVFGPNQEPDPTVTEMQKPGSLTAVTDSPLLQFLQSPEFNGKDERKKKGERTTLADLFSADAAVAKTDSMVPPPNSNKKAVVRTKHGLSFAKKLMPRKGEDSGPTTKLHRLITRMLKRKIHPEIGRDIHGGVDTPKMEPGFQVHGQGSADVNDGNELVSLIPGVLEPSPIS